MMKNPERQSPEASISKLLEVMATLRDPVRGCPWDREQTFASIAPYTIEEAYEVADAIGRQAHEELVDELGDLLLQVVFHARMGEEARLFDFADVVRAICDKLIRRHPHVFGNERIESAAEQTEAWEALKRSERAAKARAGVLGGVPVGLPALTRAAKLGRRAAGVGFDWPDADGVRDKVDEELRELDAARAAGDREAIAAEMGDVLFALANLCRHLDLDPEDCLRGANRRFETRFRHVEARVAAAGGDWGAFDAAALEALWQEAKRR
ncbi:MAG TPA: nucleoside triphosphate pyrophosphohydrolase [Gammaproteobacteria bacterium]